MRDIYEVNEFIPPKQVDAITRGLDGWNRDIIAEALTAEFGLPLWHPDMVYAWYGTRAGLWTLVTEAERVHGYDMDANAFEDDAIEQFTEAFAAFCRGGRSELVKHEIGPVTAGYGYAMSRIEARVGRDMGRNWWTRKLGVTNGLELRLLIPESTLRVVEGESEYGLGIDGLG